MSASSVTARLLRKILRLRGANSARYALNKGIFSTLSIGLVPCADDALATGRALPRRFHPSIDAFHT
jgi:hypothetical protein